MDANVLPEPAGPVEIVQDIPGDSKILSERDLKFEMAGQEVVSTDRHIRLRYPNGATAERFHERRVRVAIIRSRPQHRRGQPDVLGIK